MKTLTLACLLALCTPPVHALQDSGHEEPAPQEERKKNRLQHASSPYLLQHQYNPVDWHEWGPEAIALAKEQDKPIFLSVGYSACHWCHVMEHESFEDPEIAAVMNASFVNVKVDREERPDIDRIYMAAAQKILAGSGGWPLSVWMTPDLEPFYAGTYFPPETRGDRIGFPDVCKHVNKIWKDERDVIVRYGKYLIDDLQRQNKPAHAGDEMPPPTSWIKMLVNAGERYDETHGGFANAPEYAPKFPRCTELVFFLRHARRTGKAATLEMVENTLTKMAQGGVYDQIGGGFARYSVDRFWTVPHFEKMLYDNSQLAALYMEAWQATGNEFYREISTEILDYVAREMTDPEGGFWSTTDADSEGHEGKFFVWSVDEVTEVCGDDADVALHYFDVTEGGNFEGANILTERRTIAETAAATGKDEAAVRAAVERCKQALYERRETRVHPHLDDKMLASWNGLMLSAFARAGVVFDEHRYLDVARANAEFLMTRMRQENGRLYRTRRQGESKLEAFLEDYAFVSLGLLDLFEATQDRRALKWALELFEIVDREFTAENGAYLSVRAADESLPVQLSSARESALPSDVGTMALVALRLGLMAGEPEWIDEAEACLRRYTEELDWFPNAYGQLMILFEFVTADPTEVYLVGDLDDEWLQAELRRVQTAWPPHRVVVAMEEGDEALEALLPAAAGKRAIGGEPTSYVCRRGVCAAPRVLAEEED